MKLFVEKMAKWRSAQVIHISALTVGIILLGLFFWVRHSLLFVGFVFCYGVILPALALLRRFSIPKWRDIDLSNAPPIRLRGTVALVLVLWFGLAYVAAGLAPYVYTPPALTHKNIEFYQRCVDFARSHAEPQEFYLLWSGRLYTAEGTWLVHREFDRDELSKRFSEHDIGELRELAGLMRHFRCVQITRLKDIMLFYQCRNMFLPNRPGVAYALDGNNPNQITSEDIQELSPFIHVTNDWYCSRRLVLDALRRRGLVQIPHSLIDRAAHVDHLNN